MTLVDNAQAGNTLPALTVNRRHIGTDGQFEIGVFLTQDDKHRDDIGDTARGKFTFDIAGAESEQPDRALVR